MLALVCRYKNKREAWDKRKEAEHQQDRAFAMQAAHAAGTPHSSVIIPHPRS